ncbi:MAG TPA: PQQ-binding-like beta-propeller repeat protein [Planctomycetota bacterium]|nr:PQQ-binding-like beta-propeller repeat protein [Planctomycetota bacterium]
MPRPCYLYPQIVLLTCSISAFAEDWPQWLGTQRDSVWRETGILEKFPAGGPKIRWRAPLGSGYAGPAVAGGRVYVMDRVLDAGAKNPANPFERALVPGKERVLCLNEKDGAVMWKHEYECAYDVSYPSGPRTTPVVAGGKVYTLGAEGNLFCFDAADGKVLWSQEFKKLYGVNSPMWGFSAHPLLDGNKLICLARGVNSTVVAFDKDSGKEIWKSLTAADPGYCPPVIHTINGKRQLIIWHPEAINGLDPESGKELWSYKFAVRAGLSVPMPRVFQHKGSTLLFVTSFYNGPVMLKFEAGKDEPALMWKGKGNNEKNTDILHSIMPTPFIEDGYIYGVCSYGQFRCIEVDTGARVWESFIPTGGPYEQPEGVRWGNAFIVKNGERFFLSNEKGDLLIAKLSPKGYEELSRAHLLEPTSNAMGRPVLWSHPAYANRCIYLRNDKEIICASLAAE